MKKIAFCFLIYDMINHEDIWNLFFENVDTNKYTIYIHYKTNKPLPYFEKYKLTHCIETKYEDHTIPLAYNVLFREAYNDIDNQKFCILSGSCIPLKSFDFIYDKLTRNDYGYFNVSPQSQCFPNCHSLVDNNIVDKELISKSHNWFILNRKLVENLCFDKDDLLKQHYSTIYAPAEYFYYTFIKVLQLEKEIITTPNIASDATTFTNWRDMVPVYKYPSMRGLKNYSSVSEEELLYLLQSDSLFGRKFNVECHSSLVTNTTYIRCINGSAAVDL
jgi:Core-2/I-Branching enzyme